MQIEKLLDMATQLIVDSHSHTYPLPLSPDLLSFTAPTFEVVEGARYISVGVRRKVNPGTTNFFFNAVVNDGTAKGKDGMEKLLKIILLV